LWTPTTPAEFDAHLDLDPRSVEALAAWFGLVADALAAVHPAAAQTLWPEHFDLAVTVGEAVYGGSPGDDEHAEPYLYVSPPREPVPDGDHAFWNEPFGAALTYQRVRTTSDAVAFFTEGQSRLSGTVTELGR